MPAIRGTVTTKDSYGGSPLVVTAPTGLADGDRVDIIIYSEASTKPGWASTGFTEIFYGAPSSAINTTHLWTTISGTPPASFTLSNTTAPTFHNIYCIAWQDAGDTTPVVGTAAMGSGVSPATAITVPGITIPDNGSLWMVVAGERFGTESSATFTQHLNNDLSIFSIAADAGATGTTEIDVTNGFQTYIGYSLNVPPVAAGGPTATGSGTDTRDTATGTATATAPTATATGAGTDTRDTATGSATSTAPTSTATGAGTDTADSATGSSTATAPTSTATGSGTDTRDTATGSGTASEPGVVTATGTGTDTRDTASGTATSTAPTSTATGAGTDTRDTATGAATWTAGPVATGTPSDTADTAAGTATTTAPVATATGAATDSQDLAAAVATFVAAGAILNWIIADAYRARRVADTYRVDTVADIYEGPE